MTEAPLGLCFQAEAATRSVPGSYATIQAACDAAVDSDIVEVTDSATYTESVSIMQHNAVSSSMCVPKMYRGRVW